MNHEITSLTTKYPLCNFSIDFIYQYSNMAFMLQDFPYVLKRCQNAAKKAGISLTSVPIRGGTDGARLCQQGIPCPNLFAGGVNFHSKSEFVPVHSLEVGAELVYQIFIEKNEQ